MFRPSLHSLKGDVSENKLYFYERTLIHAHQVVECRFIKWVHEQLHVLVVLSIVV